MILRSQRNESRRPIDPFLNSGRRNFGRQINSRYTCRRDGHDYIIRSIHD